MLREGDSVGPYQIVGRIGHGGMATVYKGHHARLNRDVAIKVMHQEYALEGDFLTRFEREAQIIAQLDHPNIIPVYDFSEHEGQPYLVMKYVQGLTFDGLLNRGPLPIPDILRLMEPIAAALDYAHSQGVLHRDFKPANILVDERGTPYLGDFGLARLAQRGASSMSHSTIIGTPHYMSPEQALGQSDLDARTDVYSFGVVLYQMIVGRVPFTGDTPFSIVHDHIYTPLPAPHLINPDVSPAVENVLFKALAKDRASRYGSAAEVIAALRRAVGLETAPAQPPAEKATLPPAAAPAPKPRLLPPAPPPPVPAVEPMVVTGAPDPQRVQTPGRVEGQFDFSQLDEFGRNFGQEVGQFVNQVKQQIDRPGESTPAPGESVGARWGAQVGQFIAQIKEQAEREGWVEHKPGTPPRIPDHVAARWEARGKRWERQAKKWAARWGNDDDAVETMEERIRRRVEKRHKSRKDFVETLVTSVWVTVLCWIIFGVMNAVFGATFLAGLCAIPWPLLVMFGFGIALVAEVGEMITNAVGEPGAQRLEEEVQRELARAGVQSPPPVAAAAATDKRKNEALEPAAEPEDLAGRRIRLTDDGELTESFIEDLEAQDRARRRRGTQG